MIIRKLTEKDVTFSIAVESDTESVRGYFASGDEKQDRADEDAIIARVLDGEVWAWAVVTVIAEFGELRGTAVLGGCSYEDEAEFKACANYEDMKAEALAELQTEVDRVSATLQPLLTEPKLKPSERGIEELRRAVNVFSNCSETFNQQFTAEQLIVLFRGWSASGWDITPDRWTDEQVTACLEQQEVPTFKED